MFTPYKTQNNSFTPISDTMIKKYQEQEQPKQDGFLKTIAKDVAGTLLVKPAARTAEAIGRTGILGENIKKGYETMADEGGQNIAGIEIPNPTARNITGEALKTASYLFPYGKVAGAAGKVLGKVGGNIASGATGGYVADVGFGLSDKEQTVGQALTPGLGTALGAAIPTVMPTLRGVGRLTKKAGEKISDAVIPASTKEAQILQTYKANNPFLKRVADVLKGTEKFPQTAGKTVVEKGLMGTKSHIGVQAKRASSELWNNIISPKLKQAEVQVDLGGFFNKIQDDIVNSTDDLTRQKSLLEGLQAIKDDYAGVNAVSLEKLQKLKEGWAKFLPSKAFRGKEIGGAVNEVRRLLSNEARGTIYKTLGDDVKTAYLDYGNLQGLKEMGITSMTGQKLKGGAGSFTSELISQVVTPIGTIGGKGIYQIGKGIEFIGELGAKNLGQALGIKKFPGDAAVDDISARIKKVGQEAKAPIATKTNQTINKISSNSIENIVTPSKKISPQLSTKLPQTYKGNVAQPSQYVKNLKAQNINDLTSEQLINLKEGFNSPELRTVFDRAMSAGNVAKVKKYLPDLPPAYVEKFSKEISKVIGEDPIKYLKSLKVKGTIQKNSLISEAKKYKSADNFVEEMKNGTLRRNLAKTDPTKYDKIAKELRNANLSIERMGEIEKYLTEIWKQANKK